MTLNTLTAASSGGSVSKTYQHWADGDALRGTAAEWNNNILSDTKSDYFEGEVVPHVFVYKASNSEPLVQGKSYTFNITYNHYQANTNAGGFLYMTSPDVDRTPVPLAGTASAPDVGGFANGGGMLGNFNTVNADVTAVSAVSYTSGGGAKDGHVSVTFLYTGPTTTSGNAEIHYGLMVAAPGQLPDQGKGPTLGATAWTGGSLQTTVDVNGSGAMSLQLSPSAILVGEISGMKFNDFNGDGRRDADGADNILGTADDEPGMSGWTVFIDKDKDGTFDAGEVSTVTGKGGSYSFSVTPDADPSDPDNDPYLIREVQQAGWVQTTANPPAILISAADPREMNVDFGNQEYRPALNILKEASVPGGTANVAGEVIAYDITVQNTGNQTLTSVMVSDPFVSDLTRIADASGDNDGLLEVGETWRYSATHTVTQAEIDAGDAIVNVSTADSGQTPMDSDDASVPVQQLPGLSIVKEAVVPGGTADVVGEVIAYDITVQNTGNQTLTSVMVSDPFVSDLTRIADASGDNDGLLEVGETWRYSATHTVTQADIDAGIPIVNVSTADTRQTDPMSDDASVPVRQTPGLNIVKEAVVPGGTADVAGEVIAYDITVQNTGNQTLTDVVVSDPFVSDLARIADASGDNDAMLEVGETWRFSATHTVTQAEIDAGLPIVNVSTADSAQTDPDSDDASIPVAQAPAIGVDKAVERINGGNGNGSADFAGDVISYTVTVYNPGNITLTDVTVVDPLTGLNISGLSLAPGAAQTYPTQYVLTQADLDSNGAGDGHLDNTATVDSAQTDAASDAEQVQLLPRPSLGINKTLEAITGGNGNTVADSAGDRLNYTVTVSNEGNVTLTGVSVVDPHTTLDVSGLTLAPGDSRTYNTVYVLTQADIDSNGDGDGYFDNTATADSDQTPALSDSESEPLLRTVGLGVNKSVTGVDGGNGNSFADWAGDVLHYAITITNQGSVTLTNVSVADLLTGFTQSVASLAPGVSQTYTTSYTLTQNDLDNNGNGRGYIENIAVVDSDQTDPARDNETVQLVRSAVLVLDKHFNDVTGGNGNSLADAVGDSLNYRITVSNAGNLTLTDVSVSEQMTGFAVNGVTLAPGASNTYLSSYILSQTDLDNNGGGDGYIDNTAIADSLQTSPVNDTESVPLLRSIGMAFDKQVQSINGGNGNNLADAAGDVITYRFIVSNPGTVTLTDLSVTDPLTGLNESLASLAPASSHVFTSTYTVTQNDLDTNAGGDGRIDNLATADSNETPAFTDAEAVTVVYDPRIDLTKWVSVDNGASWVDANSPTGPSLSSAQPFGPLYKFSVANTGNITLPGVSVTDNVYDLNNGDPGRAHDFGTLLPGATLEWVFTGASYQAGQQSDVAVVTVTGMPLITDADNAYYVGV
jgi:uncharacterized repeat protein (TIGR01451 family)